MKSDGRLAGKVAAVTGGAGGIGEATVRRFAAEGAAVGFCDRNAEIGEALAKELQAQGAKVLFSAVEVQNEAAVSAFVQQTADAFGGLHVLVNNAGIRKYLTVVEATEESWDEMLAVNLKACAFTSKAAIPLMIANGGGSIVNVASIRSVVAGSRTPQYDTTKAAIMGLTRAMAVDHVDQGIRVNAVGPGPIYTDYHQQRARDSNLSETEFLERFGSMCLMKRAGDPSEIANGILFLASDEASFVTGTLLFIDGGSTAV